MNERPIVLFSATTFETCLSGRTRLLAEALSARGRAVTFVELISSKQSLTSSIRPGSRPSADGRIQVVRLFHLPGYARFSWPRLVESSWERYAANRLARWIPNLADSIVVTSTPFWARVVSRIPAALRCYDCIDHVSVQAGPRLATRFPLFDEELVEASDVILVVSDALRRDLSERFPAGRIHLVCNGVRSSWIGSDIEPMPREMLAGRPSRPLVGFLGALFEWIDVQLLVKVAALLPDVEFAFVGPRRFGVQMDELEGLPNARVLDAVPFEDVPRVIKAFDVSLIPFKKDIVSECADPLKLYEYCALGKGVVSSVNFLAGGEEAPISIGETPEQFAEAIRHELEVRGPERERELMEFSQQHTWEVRAEAFLDCLDGAVASSAE